MMPEFASVMVQFSQSCWLTGVLDSFVDDLCRSSSQHTGAHDGCGEVERQASEDGQWKKASSDTHMYHYPFVLESGDRRVIPNPPLVGFVYVYVCTVSAGTVQECNTE